MKKQLNKTYQDIISLENLFSAWQEFLPGKRKKKDAQEFGMRLADNILQLHDELANFSYVHGPYKAFNISDPKPRNIHKASVRDRVLHHAIYRKLYPFFDKTFIGASYSCRMGKEDLLSLTPRIAIFLEQELKLSLHPDKVFIKTLASGVDFLGWTHFPHHRVLRKTTGRRMFKRIYSRPTNDTFQSYLGLISHGNSYKLKQKLLNWHGLLKAGSN